MAHQFSVDVEWKGGLTGEVAAAGVDASVGMAVPAEFGGPGGAWTPEHFYAAGINTCIMATFLSIAQASKFEFVSYSCQATATMDKTAEGLRMTAVALEPRVVVQREEDKDRALRMVTKAEAMCPISHSTTAQVSIQPSVEVAG